MKTDITVDRMRYIVAKATGEFQMLRVWELSGKKCYVIVDVCICGKCKEKEELSLASVCPYTLFEAWITTCKDKRVLSEVLKELRKINCEGN